MFSIYHKFLTVDISDNTIYIYIYALYVKYVNVMQAMHIVYTILCIA